MLWYSQSRDYDVKYVNITTNGGEHWNGDGILDLYSDKAPAATFLQDMYQERIQTCQPGCVF